MSKLSTCIYFGIAAFRARRSTIGFTSARRNIAFGIGEIGASISEGTCYKKLRSLESKGFLKMLGTERGGTKIRLHLPSEIEASLSQEVNPILDLEEIDFFVVPENRWLSFVGKVINASIVYLCSIHRIM
jgi:hypothetical protein